MCAVSAWKPGKPVEFETRRLIVRSMTVDDITDESVSWWSDPQLQDGLGFSARKWQENDVIRYVKGFNNSNKFLLGIFRKKPEAQEELIGYVSIIFKRRTGVATLEIVIGNKRYWGTGIPKEITDTGLSFFFNHLKIVKFKIEVLGYNRSSLSMTRRLGFVEEGVLRQEKPHYKKGRVDVHVFGLLEDEWRARSDSSDDIES